MKFAPCSALLRVRRAAENLARGVLEAVAENEK
jgi:hypothetical protein